MTDEARHGTVLTAGRPRFLDDGHGQGPARTEHEPALGAKEDKVDKAELERLRETIMEVLEPYQVKARVIEL